jgi:hypothetical protein
VLYTVFSLWILNQPVVEENKLATLTRPASDIPAYIHPTA